MCLTNGASPLDYLEAYNIDLFLSSYEDEVEQALSKGRKCEKAMYVCMCVCVCMYVCMWNTATKDSTTLISRF